MNRIFTFLGEVRDELYKVTWPSKAELVGSTIIVCVLVAIFAVILGAMDTAVAYGIRQLIS